MRVGITYNLKRNALKDPPDAEAEFDDAGTIDAIRSALEDSGYGTELYEADKSLPSRLSEDPPDIVFNIAEGMNGRGREAQVPALLSYLGIPYTGSDETSMCVALDKSLTKKLLTLYGVPTPKFTLVNPANRVFAGGLTYPIIVKPNAEGSGKGISGVSVVSGADGLHFALDEAVRVYKQDMLVEEFIEGREFTVGILGNGARRRVFQPMEIIFRDASDSLYSFNTKRNFKEYVDYKCPPDLNAGKISELTDTAARIYDILGCKDMARIDFRMDTEGRLYFIEINPLPGLAPGYSDYPMLAEFNGVGYNVLIRGILECALTRYGMRVCSQNNLYMDKQ